MCLLQKYWVEICYILVHFYINPKNLKFFCLEATKFIILGYSYLFVTQIATLTGSYKVSELDA